MAVLASPGMADTWHSSVYWCPIVADPDLVMVIVTGLSGTAKQTMQMCKLISSYLLRFIRIIYLLQQ